MRFPSPIGHICPVPRTHSCIPHGAAWAKEFYQYISSEPRCPWPRQVSDRILHPHCRSGLCSHRVMRSKTHRTNIDCCQSGRRKCLYYFGRPHLRMKCQSLISRIARVSEGLCGPLMKNWLPSLSKNFEPVAVTVLIALAARNKHVKTRAAYRFSQRASIPSNEGAICITKTAPHAEEESHAQRRHGRHPSANCLLLRTSTR